MRRVILGMHWRAYTMMWGFPSFGFRASSARFLSYGFRGSI